MTSNGKKIRVLVVDDSASVRQTLCEILQDDPDIEVMGSASDPFVAVRRIQEEVPDVITLDIEMPRMDGLTFLGKIMEQHPIPVVICSSLTEAGSEMLFRAFEAGAAEVITKPALGTRQLLLESRIRICDAVKAAAQSRPRARSKAAAARRPVEPKLSADAVLTRPSHEGSVPPTIDKVVCIGASTGGTEALRVLLETLPANSPGIVVVQHMPEHFTDAFARRLDRLCAVTVKEAQDGDAVLQGRVLIAPGNRHLLLKRGGSHYRVEVRDGPLVSRHRPSVDVLFRSAARHAGGNAIGVLMTGMGDDGAQGLLEMRQAGSVTLAQDEASCVVYGMPAAAVKLGAAVKVVGLDNLAAEILRTHAAIGGRSHPAAS